MHDKGHTHVIGQDGTFRLTGRFGKLCLGHEVTPRLLTSNRIGYTLPQGRAVAALINLLFSFEKEGQGFLLMWIQKCSNFRG